MEVKHIEQKLKQIEFDIKTYNKNLIQQKTLG